MEDSTCNICGKHATFDYSPDSGDVFNFKCLRCGQYQVTGDANRASQQGFQRFAPLHLISARTRRAWESGRRILISIQWLEGLRDEHISASNPLEQIELLLELICRKAQERPLSIVKVDPATEYPLVEAHDEAEMGADLRMAADLGYIKVIGDTGGYRFELKGWQHIQEARKARPSGNQAFVAMWFDESMDAAVKRHFIHPGAPLLFTHLKQTKSIV